MLVIQAQADLPRHLARLLAVVPEGVRLPLLLLTLTSEEQQQVETEAWLEEWLRSQPQLAARLSAWGVQSLRAPAAGAGGASHGGRDGGGLSSKRLEDGLRWLAERSPIQPSLQVGCCSCTACHRCRRLRDLGWRRILQLFAGWLSVP